MQARLFVIAWLLGLMVQPAAALEWESWNNAYPQARTENKILLIDVFTLDCEACARMHEQTYGDPRVAAALEEQFIPVQLDVEDDFYVYEYQDRLFTGRELIAELTRGELDQYPGTIFVLPTKGNQVHFYEGYERPAVMLSMLERMADENTSAAMPALPQDEGPLILTGKWECSDGGTYYLRQHDGETVTWYGEIREGSVLIANRAYGTIDGDQIELTWTDTRGRKKGRGKLTLKIRNHDELVIVSSQGMNFEGTHWHRLPPPK